MDKINNCKFCGERLETPVSKCELALCSECRDYHNDRSPSPRGGRGAGAIFEKEEPEMTMALTMAMAVGRMGRKR